MTKQNKCPKCGKRFKRLYISGAGDRIYIHKEIRLKELSKEMGIPVSQVITGCHEYADKTDN